MTTPKQIAATVDYLNSLDGNSPEALTDAIDAVLDIAPKPVRDAFHAATLRF